MKNFFFVFEKARKITTKIIIMRIRIETVSLFWYKNKDHEDVVINDGGFYKWW